MTKRILSLIFCIALCLSMCTAAAFAVDASGSQFTMQRVPGRTQKDVVVNGERRVIYCMQYDYLWPITNDGYANPKTNYTEAESVNLLTQEQQDTIKRVLFAGYPYDSIGVLAPLYANMDEASASEAAADLTQALIWSLMAEWNVPGNTHYTSDADGSDTDFPGWEEAYNGLYDYALNGDPLSEVPSSFVPEVTGSTSFTRHEEYWMTGALSITNPEGFKIMYNVIVPDDAFLVDEDGYELFPNWDFQDGEWINLGYTVYGGDTFYLQTEHGPSLEGQTVKISGAVKLPADIKQYLTEDTGMGNKNDGQGYVQHNFQTMLSVGIDTTEYSGEAVLHAEENTVTISGHKTWIHGDNPESQHPGEILVHLHANGALYQTATVQPDEDGNWLYTFPSLPKFDSNGEEIVYTIDEGYVHDYSASYHGYNIVNTYDPGKTSINVEKIWDDDSDHDGFRPSSVVVKLLANGEDTQKTVTLTDANGWRGVFEDLLEKKDGSPIEYTLEEVPVAEYTSSCEAVTDDEGRTVGYIITNTHEAQHISVSGEKTWIHGNNPESDRPESITVFLHADGVVKETKVVTAADDWKWNFTDLDKYDHGVEIVYTVSEANVHNYIPSYDDEYSITNTYAPEQTSISVSKVWIDEHDRDGIRPEEVTVILLENLKPTNRILKLSEENHWEGVFPGLNIFDSEGNTIHYSVTEEHVDGYKTVISGNETVGYTVTNTHTPETISISGKKTWNDANNQDNKRPESITIHLIADDTHKDTVTVTEADGWKWSFTELHKYSNGSEIVYTIIEDEVDDYTASYQGYDVTNTYAPGKISIPVEKRWLDACNQDGARPAEVQVRLLADGEDAGVPLLTLSKSCDWKGSFSDLDEYKNGQLVVYTVEEVSLAEGYSSAVSSDENGGFIITNTYTPLLIDISVKKVWDDEDDKDAIRPYNVLISVYANGEIAGCLKLEEANGWEDKITGLAKCENGEKIDYTIEEDTVAEGYEAEITADGDYSFTVTNKHTPALLGSLTVSKTVKGNAGDKEKDFGFTVTLSDSTVNGTFGDMTFENGVATFTLKDGESKTAENLPAGTEYTVAEDDCSEDGYLTEKTGDEGTIAEGETSKAEFTNTKEIPEVITPETGDSGISPIWIALMFVSIAGFAGLVIFRKRFNAAE